MGNMETNMVRVKNRRHGLCRCCIGNRAIMLHKLCFEFCDGKRNVSRTRYLICLPFFTFWRVPDVGGIRIEW